MAAPGSSSHAVVPLRVYFTVFATLMILTAATVQAAYYDLGMWSTVVALAIACTKATLVVLYFMHVRYGKRLVPLALGLGIAWLLLLVIGVMTDYVSRGWLPFPGK